MARPILDSLKKKKQKLVTKQYNNAFKAFRLIKSCNDLIVKKFNYHFR